MGGYDGREISHLMLQRRCYWRSLPCHSPPHSSQRHWVVAAWRRQRDNGKVDDEMMSSRSLVMVMSARIGAR